MHGCRKLSTGKSLRSCNILFHGARVRSSDRLSLFPICVLETIFLDSISNRLDRGLDRPLCIISTHSINLYTTLQCGNSVTQRKSSICRWRREKAMECSQERRTMHIPNRVPGYWAHLSCDHRGCCISQHFWSIALFLE